jgi:magnesium transporter
VPHEFQQERGSITLSAIRRLYRRNATVTLYRLINKTHPAKMAWVYRYLTPAERRDIFKYIQRMEGFADFLSELDHALIPEIFDEMDVNEIAQSLSTIPTELSVELLESFPEPISAQIHDAMDAQYQQDVDDILQYGDDSAGRLMSHEYMAFNENLTLKEALDKFQDLGDETEMPFYIYVTNDKNKMVGIVSLRQLLLHPPNTVLKDIMEQEFVYVSPETDQEEVANLVSEYNYLALPVLNLEKEIEGIVTVDDVIDVIREEATEDMLKMAGAGEDEDILLQSTFQNVKTRFPWLIASWIGGVCALAIIGSFENILEQTIILASFIPVIMGMGGNIGTQTSTIIVRGIATGHVNIDEVSTVILKEVNVGIIMGAIYGFLLGAVAYFQYSQFITPFLLAIIVGLSILFSMFIACLVASFIPILLYKLDFDPAISTGPFVTTAIDIIGVLGYFIIAQSLLQFH